MGGHPYWYFVDYNSDVASALHDLREREFLAGRYNPAMPFIDFPIDPESRGPGPRHPSIKAALTASEADGTRSILDIEHTGTRPDHGVAVPLDGRVLQSLYGTSQPSHAMVADNLDFMEQIDRGHCVYFTVFRDGIPHELVFAGYSYD